MRAEFYALREEIVSCLALVEAIIDFGESEDIEEGVFDEGACALVSPLLSHFERQCIRDF